MHRSPRFAQVFSFFILAVCLAIFCTEASAQKVRLRAQIAPNCSVGSGNPEWKFSDIFASGNIAVMGSYSCRGAFIFDITNPDAPVLASWYNPGSNQFLEAVVIGNRGYFGSGNGGGVHIVDLTNPYSPALLGVVNSTSGNGFNSIHEMVVTGNFLIENNNCLGCTRNLKIINISNPASPVYVRDLVPTEPRWIHAMHVRGNRLFTSGWGDGSSARGRTEIYDISNLGTQAPTLLGFIQDPSSNLDAGNQMHSAWSSEDGNWLYSCREVTNSNGPTPGDLRVYDIHNPAQPILVNSISMASLGINAVTPHNPVVFGNYLYISWYQAGLQIFRLTDPAHPVRVGIYDTYPGEFVQPPSEKQAMADAEPWDLVCGSSFMQNELPTTYDGAWAVYPQLGVNKVLVGDMASGLFILDMTKITGPRIDESSDFNGDQRADISVFSPDTGDWQVQDAVSGGQTTTHFGLPGDVITPGDYDGDGKSDLAVFRPSTGIWYMQGSTAGFMSVQFGKSGDVPVEADYDSDGRTDVAVWRPSTGVWYIQQSTLGFRAAQWGRNGDKVLTGDYEGDGKPDLAVWRPSTGIWYVLPSSSSIPMYRTFGQTGDRPLRADFDGDSITDFAVYRPSTGVWYILNSATSEMSAFNFGIDEDVPVPGDYDGDSISDIAVFRPSIETWYRLDSSNGAFFAETFGRPGDKPSPSSVQPE